MRDSRGKARQISTFNGRTVVVKEASVFSNKGGSDSPSTQKDFFFLLFADHVLLAIIGFKNFSQAQLLSDVLYYHPNNEVQPWLIYYISKPLLGTYEPARIVPAVVPTGETSIVNSPPKEAHDMQMDHLVGNFSKKEIKTFSDLLANFPMIARQMEPGLDRLFTEFEKELGGKPLPPRPSDTPVTTDVANDVNSNTQTHDAASTTSIVPQPLPFNSSEYFEDDEDLMRRALETAVTSAIDLFRLVDKQQLSLLGATTDLTGPLVERLIERHIAQQVHSTLLFPRLCACHRTEDLELDAHIRQMEHLDVSQVGIAIEDGRQGKLDLIKRIDRGVVEFRKMSSADSPQGMSDVLLATVKAVSLDEDDTDSTPSEKRSPVVTVNADVLVSLLLMIIVRAQVRHLMSRLVYMQHFIFIDDVENGEIGYGLSTLEIVLTYLLRDSISLRKASARNYRLWKATKEGRVAAMRAILEPGDDDASDYGIDSREDESRLYGLSSENLYRNNLALQNSALEADDQGLSHVFPFLTWSQFSLPPQKKPKRVSMDVRSLSESSSTSVLSRTTTIGSNLDAVEGDMSIENLTKTQDPSGCSIPMMAVEASQPASLAYLLSLSQYFPIESILEDTNNYGTTLLSAAVQLGNKELIDIMLDYLSKCPNKAAIQAYYATTDAHGRTVAHYLFSEPRLLSRLGIDLPWTLKDRNGQTPLFALSRSYDHPYYNKMVNEALSIAKEAQGDGLPLRLDDHVDLKGNTLLHIVSDPQIVLRILAECDCDPNATNDRQFTPLMMASKYGRVDLVRTLFGDQRVDIGIRGVRGLTAVELAKDDDVRNRIDDLILFSNSPSNPADPSGRITTVVRSLFIEDASVRFIIKSGAPNYTQPSRSPTYTITTCRRSLVDFENLLQFLRVEHPASYIPEGPQFPSPFQIPSKPSRAVLHEMQDYLDLLLKTLLAHPTFGLHEMLWEFFLVPEMETEMTRERSQRKAAVLTETIADDYRPVTKEGVKEIEQVVSYTQEAIRAVHASSSLLIQRGYSLQNATCDASDSLVLLTHALASLQPPTNALPSSYIEIFARFASYHSSSAIDSSPLMKFLTALMSSYRTTSAVLESLSRPVTLISKLNSSTRTLSRLHSQLASSTMPRKFSFPVLEESRQKSVRELEAKVLALTNEIEQLSKEISWNKDVIVGELAGWTSWREVVGREALKKYVRASLVREKERGRRLERCLRSLKQVKHHTI